MRILPWVALAEGVGGLSAWLTREGMAELDALRQPPLTPPRAVFPVVWAALYALILYVFCLPAVVEEFAATGRWLLAVTIAMGVALFFVYDVLLGRLMARWPAKV